MGIMMSGNGVGPFIFSPVITWMIFMWDWQTAYVVLSVLMIVCLSVSCFFIRNHPYEMGLAPYGGHPELAPRRPRMASETCPARRIIMGRCPTDGGFLVAFVHQLLLLCLPFHSPRPRRWLCSQRWPVGVCRLLGPGHHEYFLCRRAHLLGHFADRYGARLALMLTLFMQGALILWLVNTQDPMLFFLYAMVWGFGYGGVGTQYGIVSREIYA